MSKVNEEQPTAVPSGKVEKDIAESVTFTDEELEYLYLHCDFDADLILFRQIEKKIRKQIPKYRNFDRERQPAKSALRGNNPDDPPASSLPHRTESSAPTSLPTADIDFSCRVCGVQCDLAPDPPARAVCPEHCEDHDYRYERELRGHYCFHCGQEAPQDWGDD